MRWQTRFLLWWSLAAVDLWVLSDPHHNTWIRLIGCVWAVWFTVGAAVEAIRSEQ